MGIKKILFPETDFYYTIERVVTDTDNKNFVVTFMIEVSRIRARDLQRPTVPKIKKLVNNILIDGRDMVKNEERAEI